ncbi:Zinc/iron permease [Terfezia boudieri ATCC MYA-4762]|uniref:Zinc/iron permease n=1 Tax=Terfezia boudieri ATCC MYA-4762 TaxID=1051890 RepID=A0A3N4LZT8_9PEZI|nr:Zinc/iron permease [Terfezia boudieri ATCC MYA-4762]
MNCPTRDQLEGIRSPGTNVFLYDHWLTCETGDPHPDWNQNPPFLAPELTTRASLVCGGEKDGRYDLPLHVLALFIILVLSTLACSFPLMVKKFPWLKVPHHFLFLSRHFGTGVLIATAFVHLLPTAFTSLTDPCLPPFWNQSYPAMAGLISMCAVFLVVTIEMAFSSMNGEALGGKRRGSRHRRSGSIAEGLRSLESISRTRPIQPAHPPTGRRHGHIRTFSSASGQSSSGSIRPLRRKLTDAQQQQKNLLQVVLLEAGILFHSVFIGMALSVATGSNFIVLLIAISFHQTFEGLALGSRIAALRTFPSGSLRPWLMTIAYGTTTPVGQAIGLATRNLYDPQSQAGLLMVGVMNAISSGLLLFAGLVELLAEDFLSDESYVVLSGRRRVQAGLAVVAGAAGMAAVGAWA